MKTSTEITAIAPALVAMQSAMKGIARDASNPEFRSKYITLDAIVSDLRPRLAENRLMVMQGSSYASDEVMVVETTVLHESGQWVSKEVVMPMVGRTLKGGEMSDPTPQSIASAMSYGRRYGLAGLFLIASDEDDDGNAASKQRQITPGTAAVYPEMAKPVGTASPTLPDSRSGAAKASDEPECPKCGGRLWDNRVGKKNPKAPDYKCRDRDCDGVIWPPKNAPATASVKPGRESASGPFDTVESEDERLHRVLAEEDSDLPF